MTCIAIETRCLGCADDLKSNESPSRTSFAMHHGRKKKEEAIMNWQQIEGNWDQFRGKFQQKWAKLTDDDWKLVKGKRLELAGRLKERYGIEKEQAEKEIDEFAGKLH